MKKIINGKEYELVTGDCEDCAFQLNPGCSAPSDLDECLSDEIVKDPHWKEVKNDDEK